MKYVGSKNRIAKQILPIILKDRKEGQWYVEPFVGGANIIDKVKGNRIGGELNKYVADMLIALSNGWIPRDNYTKDEYIETRNNKDFDTKLTGHMGINCSYSGKWFGGYAGITKTKDGVRDYQKEAHKNVLKQIENIKGINFVHSSYDELSIPDNSIIYCDPPYRNTTKYKDSFDSDKFFEWCKLKVKEGHSVFISEYSAPDDFECVWSKEVSSSLSANGKFGKNKKSVEKLFVLKKLAAGCAHR